MRRLDLATATAMAIGAMVALAPVGARAHFRLTAPAAAYNQNNMGDPQKSAPCGQADQGNTAVPSNMVTAFTAGQTITINFTETVYHPGHYRVALSTTGMAGLPADPPVTAGTMACGTTTIQMPPVLPVLADGMLPHTAAFGAPQQMMVTLPANVTCTSNCVLQVTEFMSAHGAPCFYHHCANITIAPATTGTGGAGGAAGGAGGRGGAGGSGAGGRGGAAGGSAGTGGSGSAGTTGVAGAAGNGSGGGAGTSITGTGGGAAGVTGAAGAVAGSGGATGVSGAGGPAGVSGSGSGGSTTGAAGSGMTPPPEDSGCALAGAAGNGAGSVSLLLLAALVGIARRRRRSGARRPR